MSNVSINSLADYAKRVDARPLPSDKFTVTLTRAHLKWLKHLVSVQVSTTKAQLDYYIKRDAAKHPERKTIGRFRERLQVAKDFAQALDKATKV